MNDNSSRFGKFTKIWFDDGKIVGAELEHYLLEKARLVGQGRNERNYHIFYFLLRGASPEERKLLFDRKDAKPLDYDKLWEGWLVKGKKDPKLEDVTLVGHGHGAEYDVFKMNAKLDDEPDDTGVRAALSAAKVSEETQQNIWRVVAAVLRMTNLKFVQDGDSGEKGKVKDRKETDRIAEMMGFVKDGEDGFASLLCCQILEGCKDVHGNLIRKLQNPKQCKDNCNALAKEIYGKLFEYLIQEVCNSVLKPEDSSKEAFVGLLDIFGFENFVPTGGTNSIEQLCINFANEKLQFLFNKKVFDDEKRTYEEDGIDASQMPDANDNKPCIDVVERKPKKKGAACGILRMLTDFSKTPAAKKPSRNAVMVKTWNEVFDAGRKGKRKSLKKGVARWVKVSSDYYRGDIKHDTVFHIVHYAGDIKYDAKMWLEKNADKLPKQLQTVVNGSTFPFLTSLFSKSSSRKSKGVDLCSKYLTALGELAKTLGSTEPHYVRCVKPNDYHFRPIDGRSAFDAFKTYRQLRYAGVMEVVKIKKMGYPFRETFERFWIDRCVKQKYYKFLNLDPDMDPEKGMSMFVSLFLSHSHSPMYSYTQQEQEPWQRLC
jgi:myosin heavy subunit